MANIIRGGNPNVVLLAGGGKVYTDLVARFCTSEKSLDELISQEYNPQIVKRILERGHMAATEFDFFIFGVEGVSRVTETQLVRKRIASYMIKSGRVEKGGKRSFDVIKPPSYQDVLVPIKAYCNNKYHKSTQLYLNYEDLMDILEQFYNHSLELGVPEEDARFAKPQATETKIAIGMNTRALYDFFRVRCCFKAQWEIRCMANKMLNICKEVSPDLFENAGANCEVLGYCPEEDGQCELGKHSEIPTLSKLLEIYKERRKVKCQCQKD